MAEMTYNITLTANHQSLTAEYLPLAAESVQYLTAKVACETEDWTGREIKAMFEQGCTVYEIPATGGEITAKQQLNLTAGDWRVWLVGSSARDGEVIPRITTNVAHISVAPTGGTEGNPFPTIPPTAEEQLRADMGNLADLTTEDKSSLVAAINEAAESGGSKDAVTYTPQTLTEEQKSQARTNIGAVDENLGCNKYNIHVTTTSGTTRDFTYYTNEGEIRQPTEAVDSSIRTAFLSLTLWPDATSISENLAKTLSKQYKILYDANYIDSPCWLIKSPLESGENVLLSYHSSDNTVHVSGNWTDGYYNLTYDVANDALTYFYVSNNICAANGVVDQLVMSAAPTEDMHIATKQYVDTAKTEAQQLGLTAATPGQIIKVKTVQDSKPTEWEAVDMPSGEEWEKVADIELRADTALYVLADFAVWRKAKVIMRRPKYVSGLNKNVWCHVALKNNPAGSFYNCGYLTSEYGYVYWEFSAEVSNNVISSTTLRNNNLNSADIVRSAQTLTPLDFPPTDYVFTLLFTDTSVIQDGDKVTVIGVRR